MKSILQAPILENKEIGENIFDMTLHAPEIARVSQPGQFVEVYTGRGEHLLPRPISICEADTDTGVLRLVYQAVGQGTRIMGGWTKGAIVKILGPLGNGFMPTNHSHVGIVGGGIGTPPLLELSKRIRLQNPAIRISVYLGFRRKDLVILTEEFEKWGVEVLVSTDDGSQGFHGHTVGLLTHVKAQPDIFYACGPKIMLRSLAEYAKANAIPCQVSLEERMACGLGACVGCVAKIRTPEGFTYQKVCKDGPVFNAGEVIWDE